MKGIFTLLLSFKVLKIIIGSIIALIIIRFLISNGFLEFAIKTIKSL